MILSSLFVQCGALKYILNSKKEHILGIDKSVFEIMVISWISGFLIGPRLLKGRSSNYDLTSYYILSSNAGIGFVVSFVGFILWNNVYYGIFLYFVQICSSFIIFRAPKNSGYVKASAYSKSKPLITSLSSSIQMCTGSMLEICGFTVFFTVIKDVFVSIFHIKNSKAIILLSSLMEISEGTLASVSDVSNSVCAFFTGFSVGFGGLCMCFQVFSICEGEALNRFMFLKKKLIHGIICGIFSTIFVTAFKIEPSSTVSLVSNYEISLSSIVFCTIFSFFIMNDIKNRIKKKIY